MSPQAENIWRYIETYLMRGTDSWDNNLDYGTTVDEDDVVDFVDTKFGGFSKNKWFAIDRTRYKMKVFPIQNKNTRATHAYGQVRGGGENKINVMRYKDGSRNAGFNLHIQVRRAAQAQAYKKKAAQRAAFESGGWAEA